MLASNFSALCLSILEPDIAATNTSNDAKRVPSALSAALFQSTWPIVVFLSFFFEFFFKIFQEDARRLRDNILSVDFSF